MASFWLGVLFNLLFDSFSITHKDRISIENLKNKDGISIENLKNREFESLRPRIWREIAEKKPRVRENRKFGG